MDDRQFDPDPGASVWVVASDRLAAVGARYRGHDRQAEPGAAIRPVPRRTGPAEPFEDVRKELVRKAGPVVGRPGCPEPDGWPLLHAVELVLDVTGGVGVAARPILRSVFVLGGAFIL